MEFSKKQASFLVFFVVLLLTVHFCEASQIYFQQVSDIEKFGAIPNDNKDDTNAIIAAFESKKPVYIPDGTFDFFGPISIPDKGTLFGNGPGRSILKNRGVRGENGLEFKGSGLSLRDGKPKSQLTIRDINIRGNPASGSGLVIDLARNIYLENVLISHHGGYCILVGSSSSDFDRSDLIRLNGIHTYLGEIGIYLRGVSGAIIYGNSLINGFKKNGIILEDSSSISIIVNGGSIAKSSEDGIVVKSSAINKTNRRPLSNIRIENSHWEQVQPGFSFVKVAPYGKTKVLNSAVVGSQSFPSNSTFLILKGNIEDFYCHENLIVSQKNGIVISPLAKRIHLGPNRWENGKSVVYSSE